MSTDLLSGPYITAESAGRVLGFNEFELLRLFAKGVIPCVLDTETGERFVPINWFKKLVLRLEGEVDAEKKRG